MRTLATAGVLASLVLGPFGPHLADAVAALKPFDGLVFRSADLSSAQSFLPRRVVTEPIDSGLAAEGGRAQATYIVRTKMRGTSKVIHLVKVDVGALSPFPATRCDTCLLNED